MSLDHRILYGFIAITLLTGVLAVSNARRAVLEFLSDRVVSRLIAGLGIILLMSYMILHASYRLFDQVQNASQAELLE